MTEDICDFLHVCSGYRFCSFVDVLIRISHFLFDARSEVDAIGVGPIWHNLTVVTHMI